VRICERNNSADTKVGEEGGGGGPSGAEAEVPLQPVKKTMVRWAVPLQPMEVHGGADILLQPVDDPTPEQVDVPRGVLDPMGILFCSRLLAGPVDLWRERPHTGAEEECEEEGVAETMCDELTAIPFPHPPVPVRRR